MCRLSLVAASRACSWLWCLGFSLQWLLLLQSMGSKFMGFGSCGSRILEGGLSSCGTWGSCSAACGIFLDQGLNLCSLHWQADSYPLYNQGSPCNFFVMGSLSLLPHLFTSIWIHGYVLYLGLWFNTIVLCCSHCSSLGHWQLFHLTHVSFWITSSPYQFSVCVCVCVCVCVLAQ